MRQIVLFLFVFTLSLTGAFGQAIQLNFSQPPALKVEAGNDTLLCSGHPVTLGGNPTATGGYQSYVYLWSPPDGLNDPTSSNPVATLTASATYMVSVTDSHGCYEVSFIHIQVDPCMGINESDLNAKLTVYPNPSSGKFILSGLKNYRQGLQSINLLNHLGQVVFSRNYANETITGDLVIDTGITDSGIYFLRIQLSDQVISQRLIFR
ncbi:MAG: T9SS type A sorting domain-containing protein [Bacteroidota bacterium]